MSYPPLGLIPGRAAPVLPRAALARCRAAREQGLLFPANECQQRCREAYNVPSDGTPTAVDGWHRSTHRVGTRDGRSAPYGALHRWSGGTSGDGHVAIQGRRHEVLSVDVHGPGWQVTTIAAIAAWAPRLVYLGYTLDIDGALVVPEQ